MKPRCCRADGGLLGREAGDHAQSVQLSVREPGQLLAGRNDLALLLAAAPLQHDLQPPRLLLAL